MVKFFKLQKTKTVGSVQHIRVRLRFQKIGVLRFVSHHDLMRLFERAIRRADIPIGMSQGFNPRPKMSFPAALALGIEASGEILELKLSQWIAPQILQERLKAQLPPGIELTSVEPIAPGSRSRIEELVYQIKGNLPEDATQKKIAKLLAEKRFQVPREKKGGKRFFDLRSSIVSIKLKDNTILLKLKPTKEGMARPDEVLKAIGLEMGTDSALKITRNAVHLSPACGDN